MNQLINGTKYRATMTGYVLEKGKRQIFINAKSVNQGDKAREIIAHNSFNKIFNFSKPVSVLGRNVREFKL